MAEFAGANAMLACAHNVRPKEKAMATSNATGTIGELAVGTPAGESRSWNWHPDIPIRTSPLFELPLQPIAILKWFASAWLPLTEFGLYLLLATIVWLWVQPPLAATESLAVGWVAAIWARNLVLMTVFATTLHLWLYTWHRQGSSTRFMRNAPTAQGKKFFGGHQLRDNVFWTLASGVSVWTIYETIMWLAYANAVIPMISFAEHPVWFVLCFPLVAVWQAFHFYCVHRLLHWKPLYDRFHAVHHRNITIGPWSGFSMHPVEHLLYLTSLFIFLVIPSHPVHMLFLAYWLTLATATSHSGYQELVVGSYRTTISTFFHQLHHRYFSCNYGNVDMPLDRWFGSFNDGTSNETRRLLKQNR